MTALLFSLLLMAGGADLAWYTHYEAGVRAVEGGDSDAAIEALERSLELKPDEELNVPIHSLQYVDYTPHLFLSIAHQQKGALASAREELEKSEKAGVAEKSEYGRHLLEAQRIMLTGLSSKPLPSRALSSGYWSRPDLLSPEEFETLKADILEACEAGHEPARSDSPWYWHYESALAAARKGEQPKALGELLEAIVRRPEPQRRARTYGMWLVDYYPYFQIARLHAEMGNWECARDAIQISKRLDEIVPSSREFTEFVMLDYEAQKRKMKDER